MMYRCSRCAIALALLVASPLGLAETWKTTTTWEGGEFSYPEGQAEVTSFMLELGPGETSPFHCHPVPTMGYVLQGTLEVETRDGKKKIMREGEPAVEVYRTVHRGRALDGPVKIIVFYAGSVGTPTTVRPEDDPESHYCSS